MENDQEFAILMERLRNGSEEAGRELFERYGTHILFVVREKMHGKLRPLFDSMDFSQDVWASFFALPHGQYKFSSPKDLIGFLVKIARHKVIDTMRQRLGTTKYDRKRENSLDGSVAHQAGELTARQPTPSQVFVAREQWDRLQADTPVHLRPILELLLQGHTHKEVAQKLGMNEKTIRRLLRRVAPEKQLREQGT